MVAPCAAVKFGSDVPVNHRYRTVVPMYGGMPCKMISPSVCFLIYYSAALRIQTRKRSWEDFPRTDYRDLIPYYYIPKLFFSLSARERSIVQIWLRNKVLRKRSLRPRRSICVKWRYFTSGKKKEKKERARARFARNAFLQARLQTYGYLNWINAQAWRETIQLPYLSNFATSRKRRRTKDRNRIRSFTREWDLKKNGLFL